MVVTSLIFFISFGNNVELVVAPFKLIMTVHSNLAYFVVFFRKTLVFNLCCLVALLVVEIQSTKGFS